MLNFEKELLGPFLKQKMEQYEPEMVSYDYGVVASSADDIVRVAGLSHAKYGELLEFENGNYGIALDMSLEGVSAALLSRGGSVRPESVVRSTTRVAEIGVGKELLGRVIDPIGRPLDGRPLKTQESRKLEYSAPAIMDRAPVDTPLETGILAVDSMIPIGRGQRELIIGDRQTGKTSIALSAMMNQVDSGVICVYCAIGQKASSIAALVRTLEEQGTLAHSVVVASTAADSAAMQYLAPYAACAVAEYFMYNGGDALVVYDDLSKHAVAYRAMSLLLRRPSGREAYPGDVFYLHSRLLERAARLAPEKGGGSMTALPIIETMAGDISAYIPTNVISITDGQIFLESELFHAGVRPAVNVGLSVSRVGRAAQYGAMKKVSGSLRMEVAQYRDMAVFAQFGADVDAVTKKLLQRGDHITEILKQPKEEILKLSAQVALLTAIKTDVFDDITKQDTSRFAAALLVYLREKHSGILHEIDTTHELAEPLDASLRKAITDFAAGWEA